jgi:hypothetical protein
MMKTCYAKIFWIWVGSRINHLNHPYWKPSVQALRSSLGAVLSPGRGARGLLHRAGRLLKTSGRSPWEVGRELSWWNPFVNNLHQQLTMGKQENWMVPINIYIDIYIYNILYIWFYYVYIYIYKPINNTDGSIMFYLVLSTSDCLKIGQSRSQNPGRIIMANPLEGPHQSCNSCHAAVVLVKLRHCV